MSLFNEEDAALLTKWVVGRLENISHADSDVLADYVLTLLRHDQNEDEVRQMCIEQLDDFLDPHTSQFVNELFDALHLKSYLSVNSTIHGGLAAATPAVTAVAPTTTTNTQPPNDDASSDGSYHPQSPNVPSSNPATSNTNPNPKKRGFYDSDAPGAQGRDGGHYSGNSRTKNPRAGKRGGTRGGSTGVNDRWSRGGANFNNRNGNGQGQLSQLPPLAIPSQQPGFPMGMPPNPFGVDPMAQFVAAQIAAVQGGWNPLAMFQPGLLPKSENEPFNTRKKGVCHSYQAKGFCRRGDACPYSHGPNPLVVPPVMKGQDEDEYDPHTPMLSPQELERKGSVSFPTKPTQPTRGSHRGRGNTRGGRSEFSSRGPTKDMTNKTIVVESVPDDKLNEESLRGYFVTFGTIESVDVKQDKKLAIIKFVNPEDAQKAHSSPDPIFNNRFVKVYWLRPNDERQQKQLEDGGADEMEIDMESFQQKQTEAQKAYDERQAKKREIEEQAKKLEEQKAELLRRQEEEKKKLLAKLALKHAAKQPANGTDQTDSTDKESKDAARTAALKAQLEALEAEASSLGIDHSAMDNELPGFQPSFRGRGGYRGRGAGVFGGAPGRGTYVPRGRGSFGAYRGGYPYSARGASGPKKMTLDNRTKTVLVNGVPDQHVEALQQFMLACGSQYIKVEKSTDSENSHIVMFSTRGDAARFIHSSLTVPAVGKVEASWVESGKTASNPSTPAGENGIGGNGDIDFHDAGGHHQHQQGGDLDQYDVYDMAEDDDSRWT